MRQNGLNGKSIIMTGASSGLGRALAICLATHPVKLVLHGRDENRLQETRRLCRGPAEIMLHTGDLCEKQQCDALIDACIARFGGIDLLINNAGASMWQSVETLQENTVETLMRINYFAPVYCTLRALPDLKRAHGQIVVISSISGVIPVASHSAYVAAKHAVTGFFGSLRKDLPQIKVLQVFPGWISGTALRRNALGDSDKKSSVVKSGAGTRDVDTVADLIVKALLAGRETLYVPRKLWWLPLIQAISPKLLHVILSYYQNKQ